MPFTRELPKWDNTGTKPPDAKIAQGYLFNDHPPANWFNYFMNRTYLALQELQQKSAENVLVTESTSGVMSAADKRKLNGIATNANNYTHPTTHPPSIIAQDANNRFVTDADKSNWNAKETTTGSAAKVAVVQNDLNQHKADNTKHLSNDDKYKIDRSLQGNGEKFMRGLNSASFSNGTSAMVTVTFPEAFATTEYVPFATPAATVGGMACNVYRITKYTTGMEIYVATNIGSPVTGSLPINWGVIG